MDHPVSLQGAIPRTRPVYTHRRPLAYHSPLRSLETRSDNRPPNLARRRQSAIARRIPKSSYRLLLPIPLWHLRLRSSLRPSLRLRSLAESPKTTRTQRPRCNGPYANPAPRRNMEHRMLRAERPRRRTAQRQTRFRNDHDALRRTISRRSDAQKCRSYAKSCG